MKIINPSVQLLDITKNAMQRIEIAGRTCYKSEDKITDSSAEQFCKMIQTRNHESVIEHAYASFKIICDRGVSHEMVRHRLASYSQESTRYCNYKDKNIEFIKPVWISNNFVGKWDFDYDYTDCDYDNLKEISPRSGLAWFESCRRAEDDYKTLMKFGWTPQQARSVLPNCLKTEIVMTANFREWKHFLKLRCAPAAHPDMRVVASMIRDILTEEYPVIFKMEAPDDNA